MILTGSGKSVEIIICIKNVIKINHFSLWTKYAKTDIKYCFNCKASTMFVPISPARQAFVIFTMNKI